MSLSLGVHCIETFRAAPTLTVNIAGTGQDHAALITNLWVQLLQVPQPQAPPHQLLVEHHGELKFENVGVVDGQAWGCGI